MPGIAGALLTATHVGGVLLALLGLGAIRFELRRDPVPTWRLFLPALILLLCSVALLGGLSSRGRGIWLIGLIVGFPAGSVRALWLRMRTDHAVGLVRLSPVRDGVVVAAIALVFAAIDLAVVLRAADSASPSPLFAAAVSLCAAYLSGRAIVTRTLSRRAQHRDLRARNRR